MIQSSKQTQWELLVLAEKDQDGVLTPEELARLQALLKDPENQKFYAKQIFLAARLRYDGDALERPVSPHNEAEVLGKIRRFPFVWTAVALCAVFFAMGMLLNAFIASLSNSGSKTVATLTNVKHAKWASSSVPTVEGARISAGTLELAEGLATLVFDSGAQVVMEAPSRIHILDEMNCRLERGTLFADVPPSAIGFTVDTPEAKVVDYGTKFGVSSGEDGKYLVKVIEGLVEVSPKATQEVKALRAGEGVDTGVRRKQIVTPAQELESSTWQPKILSEDRDGWHIISTAFGAGQDTHVQNSGKNQNFGKSPFFRVKYTNHTTNLTRLGFLSFDLSKCSSTTIYDVELSLSIEPSELGFASLVPDSTFSVYGIIDESAEDWEESTLTWENSPIPLDNAINSETLEAMPQLKLLGRFSVPQGANSGVKTLRSQELMDFLKSDQNGKITFIIHRDTNELGRDGLVHAFATKESARSTPPLLRIKKEPNP